MLGCSYILNKCHLKIWRSSVKLWQIQVGTYVSSLEVVTAINIILQDHFAYLNDPFNGKQKYFWHCFCIVTNDITWYHHNIRILCYQYLFVVFFAKFMKILYIYPNKSCSSNRELKLHISKHPNLFQHLLHRNPQKNWSFTGPCSLELEDKSLYDNSAKREKSCQLYLHTALYYPFSVGLL